MADGLKPFSWTGAIAQVTAGWQDGPQFKNPNLSPSMRIVNGIDPLIDQKLMQQEAPTSKIIDSWNERRAK